MMRLLKIFNRQKVEKINCKVCGKSVKKRGSSHRYCHDCFIDKWKRRKILNCEICGEKLYSSNGDGTKFCLGCRKEARRRTSLKGALDIYKKRKDEWSKLTDERKMELIKTKCNELLHSEDLVIEKRVGKWANAEKRFVTRCKDCNKPLRSSNHSGMCSSCSNAYSSRNRKQHNSNKKDMKGGKLY